MAKKPILIELEDGVLTKPRKVKIQRMVRVPTTWHAIVRNGKDGEQDQVYAMFAHPDDAADFLYTVGQKNVSGDIREYKIVAMEV